ELAQERDVEAAEKRDRLRFGRHRGGRAGEKRALFFLERYRCDVRLRDDGVDDREVPRGEACRDLFRVALHQEPDRVDQVEAFVREHGEVRLVVGGRTRLQHGNLRVQLQLRI